MTDSRTLRFFLFATTVNLALHFPRDRAFRDVLHPVEVRSNALVRVRRGDSRHPRVSSVIPRRLAPSWSSLILTAPIDRLRAYADADTLDRYEIPVIGTLAESWVDAE